jgi:hypothetical protein
VVFLPQAHGLFFYLYVISHSSCVVLPSHVPAHMYEVTAKKTKQNNNKK